MNKQNFLQTGGFPFETDILNYMQESYGLFNALGELAGNKAIIKGCEVVGSNTSDGIVYISGEVFKFIGGQTQANVKVLENVSSKVFENGDTKEVHYERYVTFASGTGSIPWSEFSRPFSMLSITSRITELEKQNAVFQADGAMVFWNKPAADIPDGWQEVTDWRGRMPVGWNPTDTDFNQLGETGGNKTRTVSATITNPISGFGVGGSAGGGDNGKLLVGSGNNEGGEFLESIRKASSAPNSTINTSINIMNPYRVVMFIEYTGS
ncbi:MULTISPECIES: hypothetical protein [Bizionia]|uniref:Uncharacterized protein n=1 Tax=Bizionia algoritergicola TaxID=291187 RepID=A0A5D0QZC0_9FLAO|nr:MULTISPECIES: hypothetical protein [Bizionia]OBX20950.1 hypothetical protein BAA08_14520 [Bizionia sp. APA-3]TYB74600.1 hypothetical protein ES675_00200 [Bizionia algoritergicola]